MKGVSYGFVLVALLYIVSSTCYIFAESYALAGSNSALAVAFFYVAYRLREQK